MSKQTLPTQTAVLVGDREQGTVLAALRHYQEFLRSGAPAVPGLLDIASNAGQLTPVDTRDRTAVRESKFRIDRQGARIVRRQRKG